MIPAQFKSLLAINKQKKSKKKGGISVTPQTINKDKISQQIHS